jgi:predicted PurR-regulated permease PerM
MDQIPTSSPNWSSTTKLLTGLVIVGIAAFLIYRFANLITPLLLIIIIVYLLHPFTAFISRNLRLSWKASVNILYLSILLILIGLLTWSGVGLVSQIQSLIRSVQEIITDLPGFVEDLSQRVIRIGPFELDVHTLDLKEFSQQLLGYVEPLLGRTGNLVAAIAGGAAQTIGWLVFILLVSYFVMVESSGMRRDLFRINIPGYAEDFERLGDELSRIWNAFLRGQIFIFTLASVVYTILFSILGVKYAIGLALMAGLAKFLPYIGPFITTITLALVTFFQPDKPFDLPNLWYMVGVMGITSITDQIIDGLITPRIMARTLKVHPAAVLVTALISANLLGIIGVVIAAPFLATVLLLGRYIMRKMFDLDPFPPATEQPSPPFGAEWMARIQSFFSKRKKTKPTQEKQNGKQQ